MLDKIKWFWKYYRDYPHVLAILLILTPLQTALQTAVPRMLGYSIDFVRTGETPTEWLGRIVVDLGAYIGLSPSGSFAFVFIGVGLISFALYAYFQSWRAWMNLRLEWMFRQEAFNGATSKGPDFFNKFRTGDLITRMTDDVADKLSWFACSGIFRAYEATLSVIFIVIMMLTIDPVLTLWTAGPLPILILIFFATASTLDKRYERLQARISTFNDVMEACFSGIRVVKAYVREAAQQGKFRVAAEDRRRAEIASVKATTVVDSLYNYIWQLGVVIVMMAGGYRVMYSTLSVGDLVTFIYYVVWLVFPMFDIGQFLVKSRQSAVSIHRLIELEKVKPMVADRGSRAIAKSANGRLVFDSVSFGFPDSDRRILDGISCDIEAGQTVAMVGKVGSGKSWMLNLIPRLVDPTEGAVKLDGVDLREYHLEELRGIIGYVPQEPVLFSDNVRNNILLGRDEVPDTLLEWSIDVAQLRDDIDGFQNGINTAIGTRGMSISGGQKQRLALARALVGRPKILVLDDCTSALDSSTEAALWERLHQVMPGITATLITHRPDTLERADVIFVLEEGRIVEKGSHADLMNLEGLYARIYKRYQLEEQVSA